jgi:putative membrane protein
VISIRPPKETAVDKKLTEQLSPPDGSESRRELAQDRSQWALQRTLFARERTFSAWLRTALAMVAAGLAFTRLVSHPDIPFLTHLLGAVFVSVGVGIFVIALWRYWEGYREMKVQGMRIIPLWGIIIVISLLILSSLAALFLVITAE